MNVHVWLTYTLLERDKLKRSIVAVIDVLRASTTICAALYHGARSVIPVTNTQVAQERFRFLSLEEKGRTALGGEIAGKKPRGFHFGNSPHEYTREKVEHKDIMFATTNGARALVLSQQARVQGVAGFVNLPNVVHWIMEHTTSKYSDVILLCSGSEGGVSYEDTLCAGAIVEALLEQQGNQSVNLSDAARITLIVYTEARHALAESIAQSRHGQYLASLGFQNDLAVAAQIGRFPVVPVMSNGRLTLNNKFSFE